jgi:polyisoprenoid-binding protein YceI
VKPVLCLVLFIASFTPAAADEWRMTEESELTFEASWEETALPGRFRSFNVELLPADGSIEGGKLVVTVDLVAADMDDPDINEAIAGEEWFSVERFPVATFTSRSIRRAEENIYVAEGELDLKGHLEPVAVPFTWEVSGSSATMTGELTLDRTRFDIGSGEWADDDSIGQAVRVSFSVVLERK